MRGRGDASSGPGGGGGGVYFGRMFDHSRSALQYLLGCMRGAGAIGRRKGWAEGWGGCGARGDGGGWVCGIGGWGVGRDRCTVASTSAWLAGMVCVRVHRGSDGGAGQSGKRGVTEGSGWRGGGRGGRGEGGGTEGGVGGVGGVGGGKGLEVRVALRGLRPGMVYRVWVVGVSKEGVRGAKSEAISVETRGRVLQSRPLRVALAALCASCVLQPNLSCAQAALGRGLHIPYACGRALGQFLHFSYALDTPPPYPAGGHEVGGAVAAGLLEGAAGQTHMCGADVSSSPQDRKKKIFWRVV